MTAPTLVPPSSLDATHSLALVVYFKKEPHSFALTGRMVLGRGAECDIVVPDTTISREHATLTCDHAGNMLLLDHGSTNGTWVNGERLAPHVQIPVDSTAAIRFGSVHAEVQFDGGRSDTDKPPEHSDVGVGGFNERTVVDGFMPLPMLESAGVPVSFVADDPRMKEVVARLRMISGANLAVLVYGETGVGKERIAAYVHALSRRATGPYVKINCAAIPEGILESELFGYDRGAFTGANSSKAGLLETAHEGTLFLDEIGEMALTAQAKLLRVLETREVTRLGALKPRAVDVRIISATNRDLRVAIREGRFRPDLFYRLQGLHVFVPPLRERPKDLLRLADMFVNEAAHRRNRGSMRITQGAIDRMLAHTWPGNVRELRNTLERSVVLAAGNALSEHEIVFDPSDVFDDVPGGVVSTEGEHAIAEFAPSGEVPTGSLIMPGAPDVRKRALELEMVEVEKARVMSALAEAGGNQTRAAKILGISRGTLIARIEEFGITRPRKSPKLG